MRGKTRPPYDPEFRKRAVQLVVTQGLSKQQVADDLGCSYESLRNWVKQHEIDEGKRQGPSTAELDELRSLRRENKILREEREILRKAAAFFARETM
jgi:Transposase and inactivated derivatives